MRSRVRITSEYAPTQRLMAERMRSVHVAPWLRASIIVITSVSEEVERPTPWRINSARRSAELTRLPLCASASGPWIVSITKGCALRAAEEPVVE
jgi:hypothetical protein